MPKKKKQEKKTMESGTLTGSSCEPHFYIPIPLTAANTPLYGSSKLETRSVSSGVVRRTSNTSLCVGDTLHIGSKHVTHRLEISFGYAKHYLDVFRLMSNFQVTCVDVCQRSRNVPTTYGQRMRNVWVICWHTSQNFKHVKICRRARRTTTYVSVLQRALNVYKT